MNGRRILLGIVLAVGILPARFAAAAPTSVHAPYDAGSTERGCWIEDEAVPESDECRLIAVADHATGRLHAGFRVIGRTTNAIASAVISQGFTESGTQPQRFTVEIDVSRYFARQGHLRAWLTDEDGKELDGVTWRPERSDLSPAAVTLELRDRAPEDGRRVRMHVEAQVDYYGSYLAVYPPYEVCPPIYLPEGGLGCFPTYLPPLWFGRSPVSERSDQYAEIDASVRVISTR